MNITSSVTSAALIASSMGNLTINNTNASFFAISNTQAGLVLNVSGNVTVNNLTQMLSMNQSSATYYMGEMFINFTGSIINVNNSTCNFYSNSAFSPLVANNSGNCSILLNMSVYFGEITG